MTQTNPEQWAVELGQQLGASFGGRNTAARLIQAAFAEQNARLVGALEQIKREARKNKPDPDQIYATTLAALKDRTHD